MKTRRIVNFLFSWLMIVSLLLGGTAQASAQGAQSANPSNSALPASPTDETKVPHYFGPYPNWANSPYTLADAVVTITGNGLNATAVATVGAGGSILAIDVVNPGTGYTSAKVDITGGGTGATAQATIVKKGAVVGIAVNTAGTGYTAPAVTISGNGTGAAATAYGSVEQVNVSVPGSGYTFPTVDFDLPDAPDGIQAKGHAVMDVNGAITGIVVDQGGSGYLNAPGVIVRDGTIFDPILNGGGGAVASSTLVVSSIVMDTFGSGYGKADVFITDPTGTGATATASLDNGIISAITVTKPGSGYLTAGGIQKFVDTLPGLGPLQANNLGQYMPVAEADTTTFTGSKNADYYVIAVVQHREKMHSSLPPTLLREYVQLSTSAVPGKQVALRNDLLDGTSVPALMPDGTQAYGVDDPHYLGPVIVAQKNRAVRITFYNLLPKGAAGDLFLPTDSTIMGSGMGPMPMMDPMDEGTVMDAVRNPACTEYPKAADCFKDNRATLHLHGGVTPWISDGTPHQWITPASESTMWPQGVSVAEVPDMINGQEPAGVPDCSAQDDGCQTFYYTNQQSARLMFYHDHSWGITRLNVYAGEAAGYVITDPTEQALLAPGGAMAGMGTGIPLVIQDRTFVPQDAQLYGVPGSTYGQDPTWDAARWGSYGNLWYHHVYMPAQNPGDPSGMSAYGRWMYGPWFWPPAKAAKYPPIDNPYYDPNCDLNNSATWQYQTDPFCEPAQIPGTPNISAGMEQFNDTPIVNGTAYPTTTLDPKSYRFRILNAANDRFWNLQWYVADATGTEVALKAAEVAAAQTDPNVFPTPDTALSPVGPSWIQIGTEGGFLPAPVVVPNQPITWITDPTRFDVGNVDKHALLLAPAERADVIVDFSKFAGKTLILYNDAPAAFPARVASYDYYTGAPDLSPAGAPSPLPGYGPNTRTIMQVKITNTAPAAAFNLTALNAAFRHHADGSGVFESGQHPIIVGQAAYNSAYGTSFVSAGYCNSPTRPSPKCDGFARIADQGGELFKFDTLAGPQVSIPLEPKALHDEMNSSSFDEFGRMTANLGLEAVPATPGLQNVILYPYVVSPTELIDGTNLLKGDMKITPIASADGSQIWKITHNGVDTHPIHFHLYDVQILNRVTWDNIIIPPDATELGWKDTVRISPLEDTIVALRPIIPALPFDIPNSVRELSPMMPDGVLLAPGLTADPQGNPVDITNHLVNFGWEYVYHCHILSHEEMDMMRPVILAVPPVAPTLISSTGGVVEWQDNSVSETAFVLEKSSDAGVTWGQINKVDRLLTDANTATQVLSFTDINWATGDIYRVAALNTVGDVATPGFPTITVKSLYGYLGTIVPPTAPTNLSAALEVGPQIALSWTDTATTETGFIVQRADNGGAFAQIALAPAFTNTGKVSFIDNTVVPGSSYQYQLAATNTAGPSAFSNIAGPVNVPAFPAAPVLSFVVQNGPQVALSWTDTNETSFILERSLDGISFTNPQTLPANTLSFTDSAVAVGTTYWYQVKAVNQSGSATSNPISVLVVAVIPAAPSSLVASLQAGPQVRLSWTDNAIDETGFTLQRSDNGAGFIDLVTNVAALPGTGSVTYIDTTVLPGNSYDYQVAATNSAGASAFSNIASVVVPALPPAAPTGLIATNILFNRVDLAWTDNASNETGFVVERSADAGLSWGQVGQTAADVSAFSDTSVAASSSYLYRVYAFNTAGPSGNSNELSVTTPAAPTIPLAPTTLAVVATTGTTASVTWVDTSSNENGFYLEWTLNGANNWTVITLPADTTSYTIQGLSLFTKYQVRVKAFNLAGSSAYSNTITITTKKK
jgi:FtsP/CotA-like multicopper oxidase with cupredoxin domain